MSRFFIMKKLKAQFKGLLGEKVPFHEVEKDSEFDVLYYQFKDLPEWIDKLNPTLNFSVDRNHEATHRNADSARDFLTILDDERSGEECRQLVKELREDIHKWQMYDTSERMPIFKAQSLVAKLHAVAQEANRDIEHREVLSRDLGQVLTELDELHGKDDRKGEAYVPDDRVTRKKYEKDQLQIKYNEANLRAKHGMRKTIELTPRVVYLLLYGYCQWSANSLGFRPMIWAAEPLSTTHAELRDVDRWEDEPLHGRSIREILESQPEIREGDITKIQPGEETKVFKPSEESRDRGEINVRDDKERGTFEQHAKGTAAGSAGYTGKEYEGPSVPEGEPSIGRKDVVTERSVPEGKTSVERKQGEEQFVPESESSVEKKHGEGQHTREGEKLIERSEKGVPAEQVIGKQTVVETVKVTITPAEDVLTTKREDIGHTKEAGAA